MARDLAAAADVALQAAVDRARAAGQSSREIGDVLGTSRQAAFQRFGHPVDPRTGEPMSRDVPPGTADRAVAITERRVAAAAATNPRPRPAHRSVPPPGLPARRW